MWIYSMTTLLVLGSASQHPANDRGGMVMGFDPDKTTQHFYLHERGDAIDVTVMNAGDTKERAAVQLHFSRIAMMSSLKHIDHLRVPAHASWRAREHRYDR